MIVEGGEAMDLVRLLTANSPWESGADHLSSSLGWRMLGAVRHRLGRINMERRSRRNVAHHYENSDRLYTHLHEEDRQ